MRNSTRYLKWSPWLGAVVLVPVLGFMSSEAHAQGEGRIYACYVPDVGAVYRIKEAGLPQACFGASHVEFGWYDLPGIYCEPGAIARWDGSGWGCSLPGRYLIPNSVGETELQDGAITDVKLGNDVKVRGWEINWTDEAHIDGLSFVQFSVDCTAGKRAISGGFRSLLAGIPLYMSQSYPTGLDHSSWQIELYNPQLTGGDVMAFVICVQ